LLFNIIFVTFKKGGKLKEVLIFLLLLALAGCSSGNLYRTDGASDRKVHRKFALEDNNSSARIESKGSVHYWVCSFYGTKFHGRQTSNGEIFDMYKMTCAHKELPFNTRLKVTNEDNGRSVVVRINDRGPFVVGRDLDLSYGAARELDMIAEGVKTLKVQILD
jgi:rare lipoprotein A